MSNILSQFEELLTKIIDTKVEEKISSMNLLDGDSVKDMLSEEIKLELEAQEVPDTYGVREIVSEEIDNIDWNDRVNESGALEGMVTEDTLEGTLDEVVSNEYVTRGEFEDALDGLSISRG
tara:strand:+ start:43 stop:405 length:363 start_codon:yes stop_codon:yes gene_type:complete